MTNVFFKSEEYEMIDEKKLLDEELEAEINSLRLLKKQFRRTIDDIDTQMICFKEELLKRKEREARYSRYGE